MRDDGGMGENEFQKWCSEVGINANPSIKDKTGWDYHLEFPFTSVDDPNDIHKSALECRIQVKSTDKIDQ